MTTDYRESFGLSPLEVQRIKSDLTEALDRAYGAGDQCVAFNAADEADHIIDRWAGRLAGRGEWV